MHFILNYGHYEIRIEFNYRWNSSSDKQLIITTVLIKTLQDRRTIHPG